MFANFNSLVSFKYTTAEVVRMPRVSQAARGKQQNQAGKKQKIWMAEVLKTWMANSENMWKPSKLQTPGFHVKPRVYSQTLRILREKVPKVYTFINTYINRILIHMLKHTLTQRNTWLCLYANRCSPVGAGAKDWNLCDTVHTCM